MTPNTTATVKKSALQRYPMNFLLTFRKLQRKIYTRLGCNGIVRFDYIDAEDGLYFLEANTIPGTTSASLVPKTVRAAMRLDMTEFLTSVIENS